MIILFKLILWHLFVDFFTQTIVSIDHKKEYLWRSHYLYTHCLLHIFGSLLIFGFSAGGFANATIIGFTHFVIDVWKLKQKESFTYFIFDQLFHLMVILIVYIVSTGQIASISPYIYNILSNEKIWVIAVVYLFLTMPCAYIMQYLTKHWNSELIVKENQVIDRNFNNASWFIGVLERILIVTFILYDHIDGVGYIITIKSILRYVEAVNENLSKKSDYIIIGTLASSSIAIFCGLILKQYLK
jgi:hypothetical protein